MAPLVDFPDVEDALVQALGPMLSARGDTATVHVAVPRTRPERFVLVPRVGGNRESLTVDAATIAVECWAKTPGQAYALCRLVRALVHGLAGTTAGGAKFKRITEFAGPANLPDPDSDQARYTFTAAVRVAGSAL